VRTIKLGDRNCPLQLPAGLRRLDFRMSYPGNEAPLQLRVRWAFAALGLCWADKSLGWPDPAALGFDYLRFGEQVYLGLESAGLRPDDNPVGVLNAMIEVLNGMAPAAPEQKAAETF